MLIQFCKAKIAHATVTEAELYYEGSITIDEEILHQVGVIPGEKVDIVNINNGNRLETYVIAGKKGSGHICLNGPAARMGYVGDKIIILSYALITPEEAKTIKTQVVYLDEANHPKS